MVTVPIKHSTQYLKPMPRLRVQTAYPPSYPPAVVHVTAQYAAVLSPLLLCPSLSS